MQLARQVRLGFKRRFQCRFLLRWFRRYRLFRLALEPSSRAFLGGRGSGGPGSAPRRPLRRSRIGGLACGIGRFCVARWVSFGCRNRLCCGLFCCWRRALAIWLCPLFQPCLSGTLSGVLCTFKFSPQAMTQTLDGWALATIFRPMDHFIVYHRVLCGPAPALRRPVGQFSH